MKLRNRSGWAKKVAKNRHGDDFPWRNWKLRSVQDVGEDRPDCEFCGHPGIRWLHLLEHEEVGHFLDTGCCCAEILTGDYVNPRAEESKLKSAAKKKAALEKQRKELLAGWLVQGNWTRLSSGGWWRSVPKAAVQILPHKPHGWAYYINRYRSYHFYPSQKEALEALFDKYWKLYVDWKEKANEKKRPRQQPRALHPAPQWCGGDPDHRAFRVQSG